MGKMTVQGRDFVTPKDEMTVGEIKELAGIPRNERVYQKDGKVFESDADVVKTENAHLDVMPAFERG